MTARYYYPSWLDPDGPERAHEQLQFEQAVSDARDMTSKNEDLETRWGLTKKIY